METRTLLTVIALLLAGVVTIMLVREGTDDAGNIFSSNNYSEFSNSYNDGRGEQQTQGLARQYSY